MNEQQPTLIVMCGLPFAGKSTLARELAATAGAAHVEIDRINMDRAAGLNGAEIDADTWATTYAEAFRQIERHLVAGRSVIFDATNYTRRQRDDARAIADAHGARSAIIHVIVVEGEARRHWLANRATGERNDVRDEDFLNVVARFEPPGDDEGTVIRFDGRTPASASAQQILDTLRLCGHHFRRPPGPIEAP